VEDIDMPLWLINLVYLFILFDTHQTLSYDHAVGHCFDFYTLHLLQVMDLVFDWMAK